MSTAMPSIPPRPSRSGAGTTKQDIPLIPPRPARLERSPSREPYTRSPLNELPSPGFAPAVYSHRNLSASDLPERPPSVPYLPSIGHEGDEYASLERTSSGQEEQRAVAADVPMLAPTASIHPSTAKSRIQTVTKAHSEDDKESVKSLLRPRASFNRSTPSLLHDSRPASIHESEHHLGIPEIGVQVPMYPHAGDVQAPSPAPSAIHQSTGVGFFNNDSHGSPRNHHRRRSSKQDLNPPGSYGMHGHGLEPRDQFEKAWYQRHPEEMAKEIRHPYDPGHPRSEWALSSEQLNQLVHSSKDRGLPPNVTPDEQTGYRAVEQYSSRKSSPRPNPLALGPKRPSNGSQTHVESPLRKTNFPFHDEHDHHALESEDDEHHAPSHLSKVRTLASTSSVDLPAQIPEEENEVPILASDELAKYPTNEYHQPAVVEYEERRARDHGYDSDSHRHRSKDRHGHRSTSRPSSAQGGEPLQRLMSHDRHEGSGHGTPLHEIQEYEPLFPDDDEQPVKPKNKHLRPDLARHHFPSRDIWEDTPDSLGLTAEVTTPDLPLNEEEKQLGFNAFESPGKEAERQTGGTVSDSTRGSPSQAPQKFKAGVQQDFLSRPGLHPRFPSQDIWEDSPDSMHLETTVSGGQTDDNPYTSPTETVNKPFIPARPAARTQSILPEDVQTETSPTEKKAPSIPERPKPTVPSRPGAKPASATSPTEGPQVREKPLVPSRPAGKLASIKASFMNDLNSRLQLGPQVPKKEEPKEEAAEPAPLEDARKSRARGPARRKPAAAAAATTDSTSSSGLSFSTPKVWFSLDNSGALNVGAAFASHSSITTAPTEKEEVSALPSQAVGAEGDVPEPGVSKSVVEEQQEIQPVLAQALAEEPAPASAHAPVETEHASSATKEEETQTGESHITFTSPQGEQEKFTAYRGGQAPEEGDVLVKEDGTQVSGASE